jgi:AcrR family transcriptional regulator
MATTWHQEVRNRNREEFITAGQKVLLERNFINVSHKEVCERANLSKVTFYKCFTSMDELIFAIQIKVLGEITEFIMANAAKEQRGLDSVKGYLDTWIRIMETHSGHLKFIGFFDHTYKDQYPTESLRSTYTEVIKEAQFGKLLIRFVQQGVEDGSIRNDIHVEKIVLFILEMIISLMQRLASRGQLLEEEHGFSWREIAETSKEFVIGYLEC